MVDYSASELRQKAPLLKQCLSHGVEEGEFAGASFLLAKDNEEILYFDHGYADLAMQKPIRRDSIYRCYSLTKTVTAAAIMSLVEEGRLDLRDPVEKFLPSFANAQVQTPEGVRPAKNKMTVQNLLNMTSGLGYGAKSDIGGAENYFTGDSVDHHHDGGHADNPAGHTDINISAVQVSRILQEAQQRLDSAQPMTTQEFAERLGHCILAFEPGTSWCYGVSADILGAIVERVTGETYSKFLKERIFDPLGMADTGFYVPEDKKSRLVNVYAAGQGESTKVSNRMTETEFETANSATPEEMELRSTCTIVQSDDRQSNMSVNEGNGTKSRLFLYRENDLCIRNDGNPNPLESGGAGLFSTIDDFFRFTQMLLRGGRGMNGSRILRLGTVQFMTRHALMPAPQRSFEKQMPGLEGFTYSNLLRIMQHPEYAATVSREGEYGWDGALGTYWCNSPTDGITILLMMNQKGYETGRVTHMLRNIVFG